MNEQIRVPKWAPVVFVGAFILAILINIYANFVPIWINFMPIATFFISMLLAAMARARMKLSHSSKTIYFLSLLIVPVISLTLLIDRFGDLSPTFVLPAHVLHFTPAAFLAGPDVSLIVTYPNGKTEEVVVSASKFNARPASGTPGKVVMGKGLFGIQYFKTLEYNDAFN